jgi:hypothetical protein
MILIITLMMEEVISSESSVNMYQTIRCNIPEDSHLHTRRRENLKSHKNMISNNNSKKVKVKLSHYTP